jgi:hypothetical protein
MNDMNDKIDKFISSISRIVVTEYTKIVFRNSRDYEYFKYYLEEQHSKTKGNDSEEILTDFAKKVIHKQVNFLSHSGDGLFGCNAKVDLFKRLKSLL